MRHETLWIPQDVRTAATPRRGAPAARVELARGGPPRAGLHEFRITLATGVDSGWGGGSRPHAGAGVPMQVDGRAMHPAPPPAVERRQSLWLPQRTVDLAAHRGRD